MAGWRARLRIASFWAIGIVFSVLLAVLAVETAWPLLFHSSDKGVYAWERRIMFFDAPKSVFRNVGDIYLYSPHNVIKSRAVYFTEKSYAVEYEYVFRTNNFGLVQDNDIDLDKPSLLILGDSITEGQGAEPWFRRIQHELESLGLQPINGGILGTGFQHWWELENLLSERGLPIKKVLVIFVSDDFQRRVWNFPAPVLACMNDAAKCDGSEGFYPRPPDDEIPQWVDRIRRIRMHPPMASSLKQDLLDMLPATHLAFTYARQVLGLGHEHASAQVIARLIEKYGRDNVAFLHVPQKDEIAGPNVLGRRARAAIAKAGGRLVDGFDLCPLARSDFFANDGHPNASGYMKIAHCAVLASRQLVQPTKLTIAGQ